MFFKVEFSYLHASGEFKPVMRQSFDDLKVACDYAGKRVMECAKTDRIHATVSNDEGRVLHQCWIDEKGRFRDATYDVGRDAAGGA